MFDDQDMKPDIRYWARVEETRFDFVVIEVNLTGSAFEDDIFKVSIELQSMINRLIKNGIRQPVAYGVVIDGMVSDSCFGHWPQKWTNSKPDIIGFICDMYRMDLAAPSVYLLTKMYTCRLPKSGTDFHVLLETAPAFFRLNQIACDEVRRVRADYTRLASQREESSQLGWIKTPIIQLKQTPYFQTVNTD